MNDRRTSRALLFIRCSDGRILQANEAAEHIYQRSQKELAALTIRDLCARDTKVRSRNAFRERTEARSFVRTCIVAKTAAPSLSRSHGSPSRLDPRLPSWA